MAVVRNRTSNVCSVAGPDGNVAARELIIQTVSNPELRLHKIAFENLKTVDLLSEEGKGGEITGGGERRFRLS